MKLLPLLVLAAVSLPVALPVKAETVPARAAMQGQGCPCPYDLDRRGNECGGRSAYSRPGGSSPVCYVEQKTQAAPAQSVESAYSRYMRIGYAAAQSRDYQTALINFRRALNESPGDSYATKAIENMEKAIASSR